MKYLQVVAISLLALLAPIKTMAIAAMVITLLDLPLGLWAAHKRKEPITSSGLKRTVIKLFVYEIALVLGLIIQVYLIDNSIQLINLISTLIGCTEGKSCIENLEEIYGRPFLSQIISLIDKRKDSIGQSDS